MDKLKHKSKWLLVIGLIMLWAFFAGGMYAEAAADEYKPLFGENYKLGESVKCGKYYFKYSTKDYKVYVAKSKKGPYKKTSISYQSYTNGKQIYYVSENRLCKYVCSSGKETKLKKLPDNKYWKLSLVYGGKVFLTGENFDEWSLQTYVYKISSKKLSKAANVSIITNSGKYVLTQDEYRSDVSPYQTSLYRITANGMKKVKTLSKRCFGCRFVGDKLYYTDYGGDYMEKVTLYKCNRDGSGKKKLAFFETDSEYGAIYVTEITSKYCVIMKDDATYRYTYKTKKLKKIS